MRILTDSPDLMHDFAGPGDVGCPARPESLPREEMALWCALGAGPALWIGTAANPEPLQFWQRAVIVQNAPTSQFDVLNELLGAGLELSGPAATVALRGRNFHGLRGRPWAAVQGNLHMCAAFQAGGLEARNVLALTMLPAVSVVQALQKLTAGSVQARIKWVNDILVGGRKVGGVLTTTRTNAGVVSDVVFGIGLNLLHAPEMPWTPFVPAVGCLMQAGVNIGLAAAFHAILAEISCLWSRFVGEGPRSLFEDYRASSLVVGREVCIWEEGIDATSKVASYPPPLFRGIVRDINPDLSLVLQGVEQPVTRGRLAFAEHCPSP